MNINKELLYEEMDLSLERGELTEYALEAMQTINENVFKELEFKNKEEAEFCKSEGEKAMMDYWVKFNPDHPAKPNSAFNFLRTMSKNGHKKGWNKFHKIGWYGDPKRDEWIKKQNKK